MHRRLTHVSGRCHCHRITKIIVIVFAVQVPPNTSATWVTSCRALPGPLLVQAKSPETRTFLAP